MQGQCPYCRGTFEAPVEWIGRLAECPFCHRQFTIYPDQLPNAAPSPAAFSGNQPDNWVPDTLLGCYQKAFVKYFAFSGRASRKEFWGFVLWNFLINFCLGVISNIHVVPILQLMIFFLSQIYGLAVLIPSLAVTVRRLHDVDKSGCWLLFPIFFSFAGFGLTILGALIGFKGVIWFSMLLYLCSLCFGLVLFIDFCRQGTPGANRYGNDPYD